MQKATFGGGCFWYTEAIFQILNGVKQIVSGYMGGKLKHPTYMEICKGGTGHAEVVQIEFDETIISFHELLLVFFKIHNPTSLNEQGNDRGTQYRSIVFYENEDQKVLAEKVMVDLTNQKVFDKAIRTEIAPVSEFYEAEDYHQNYFNQNHGKPFCSFVIQPKLNKFIKDFEEKIDSEYLRLMYLKLESNS